MSEHLTQNQIEAYGRRKLSATELLSVSDHLDDCKACRRQVERALDGDAAYLALKSEVFGEAEILSSPAGQAHLTLEQTAGVIDETLAGEELQLVRDHLNGCDTCALAVSDLRVFRDQVAPELNREYQPSPVRVTTENRWHRLFTDLPSLLPRSPVRVFGWALTALLLTAAGWLIWQALQRRETKTEITVTTPSPTVTPPVLPNPAPGDGAAMVIARLNDGESQVTLNRDGNLSGIANLPPAYQQVVKEALTNQRLEKSPLLAGLTPGTLVLRGGKNPDSRFSMIEPVGRVLLSDRPTFRWSRLDGATSYVVEIYDEKFNLVTASPQLIANSWTASESLKRGGIYSWQVKVTQDGQEFIYPRPPAPLAKFRILDQARANELIEERRTYASSHLTLALLYTQAGLLDEAERELRALQKANPDSAIVRRLLANLQAMRR